jgi:hypothetical protein
MFWGEISRDNLVFFVEVFRIRNGKVPNDQYIDSPLCITNFDRGQFAPTSWHDEFQREQMFIRSTFPLQEFTRSKIKILV